jgi:hypothetical protein
VHVADPDEFMAADTVVVVTDDKGVIVATAHGRPMPPLAPVLEIRPGPGQRVHTIVLPPELRRLGLRERVDRFHDSYRVSPAGQLSQPPKIRPADAETRPPDRAPWCLLQPAGATGFTSAGTSMVCKISAMDSRLGWRRA